jgi:ferredoxin
MPENLPLVRFFRGSEIIGHAAAESETTLVEVAELAGINIPTNCTSGNCGTCLVRLISGEVELPEPLPPGLDDDLVSEGGILTCCLFPSGNCDIDIIPPL